VFSIMCTIIATLYGTVVNPFTKALAQVFVFIMNFAGAELDLVPKSLVPVLLIWSQALHNHTGHTYQKWATC